MLGFSIINPENVYNPNQILEMSQLLYPENVYNPNQILEMSQLLSVPLILFSIPDDILATAGPSKTGKHS